MTPAQIQTLIDACRTSPTDLVTWLELKAVLEGLKNQDLGLTLTTTGTSGAATLDIDTDILNIPNYSTDLTVYVPYTGANQNVTLGEYGIRSGWYQFDLTPTGTPTSASTMYWDDNQKTVALVMGGTTQEIGHDQFYHAKNSTGSTIPKGTAVGFAGTDGGSGHLLITPFIANGTTPSSYFMGVTAEAITNGSFGKVQSFGRLDGIDTSAFAEGDILYVSTTTAGAFQTTIPVAPNNIIQVAAVVSDSNNGKLLIRPTLGSKLTSDESVRITSVANGQVLQYNSSLAVWQNVAPSTLAVNNIYTADGTLTGNRTVTMGGNWLNFSGGNVGINQSAPTFRLDVNGTMRVQGNTTITTNLNLSSSSFPTASAGLNYAFIGRSAILQADASSNSVLISNNGYFTGSVDQYKNAGAASAFFFDTSGNINMLTATAGSGGGTITWLNRIFISNNGNIGINTTTDAGFRLDVNGTMRVQGNTTITGNTTISGVVQANLRSGIGATSSGASWYIQLSGQGAGVQDQTAVNTSNYGSIDSFPSVAAATAVTGLSHFVARNGALGAGASVTTQTGIDITALTLGSTIYGIRSQVASATNRWNLYINGTAANYIEGNLGIGTTSPTYTLHVVGTSRITGNTEFSTASGAYMIVGATGDTSYRLSVDGDLRVYGNIRTAQPTGGTGVGVWRLGSTATGTYTMSTTVCVEIEIGGTLYKLATVS